MRIPITVVRYPSRLVWFLRTSSFVRTSIKEVKVPVSVPRVLILHPRDKKPAPLSALSLENFKDPGRGRLFLPAKIVRALTMVIATTNMSLTLNSSVTPCSARPTSACSVSSALAAPFPVREMYRHRTLHLESSKCRKGSMGMSCQMAVSLGGPLSGEESVTVPAGSRIKVTESVKVYHIPKVPEYDLQGAEGEVKDVLGEWKGKSVSANLPLKCEFLLDIEGKSTKVIAHLKSDEVEVV